MQGSSPATPRDAAHSRAQRAASVVLASALALLGGLLTPAAVRTAHAEGVPQGAPPAGQVDLLQYTRAGTLGGAMSVGWAGGVAWSTSLKTVPGVEGMEPALGIGYGGGGYGGLGVGFSLDAGGSISRCRETLGQDGAHETLHWTQADPLCLDGARLIAVAPGKHGAGKTEYRVQTAPNVRVVALGASTDPFSGFLVYTPDGRATLYGTQQPQAWTSESVQWAQVGATRVPFAWHVARVQDTRTHNEMRYRYTGEAAPGDGRLTPEDHRLVAIEYGINAQANADSSRQVLLAYTPVQTLLGAHKDFEVDAWVQQGYVAGMAYTRRQVLTRVEMQVREGAAWSEVRHYKLGYEPVPDGAPDVATPDRVRLATLQECAQTVIDQSPSDAGVDISGCFRPTTFEWSLASASMTPLPGFGIDNVPFYPLPPASKIDTQIYRRVASQVVGDFDGDGDDDFLVMPEEINNPTAPPYLTWGLWETDKDKHGEVGTNIASWSAQGPWTNRAGTVVPVSEESAQLPVGSYPDNAPLADRVRPADPVQTGYRLDEKATPMAWAMNYDGTGGTDVLIGEPQLELAGALMDAPWGVASRTAISRYKPDSAPWWCFAAVADITPDSYLECVGKHMARSAADYTAHPGFLRGLTVLRLDPAAAAPGSARVFKQTSLHYPDGHPMLYVVPLDLDGDGLQDLMFCKADADYSSVAGKAMPMFYPAGTDPVNWVSGTMHYALNVPGHGIDLANGGLPATADGSLSTDPWPCHAKDSTLVMDLDGTGRQSLLHRLHPHAKQVQIAGIAPAVPAGPVDDPYPRDPNDATLTSYWNILREYVWAKKEIGASTYNAFRLRADGAMTVGATGLPYESFMRWQHSGNTERRYSTHHRSNVSDEDGGVAPADLIQGGIRDARITDWGSPDALMVGGGPSELRTGDFNGDGLTDVLMVDMSDCRYGTLQDLTPIFVARTCSFQDVTEFGRELLEQTYEKLAVFVYLNRGDGTFDLGSTHRLWDTDVTDDEKALLETGYVKGNDAVANELLYRSAWTHATAATRGWRMEFGSSFVGDGNGDGLADLGYLKTQFTPDGGWIGDSMSGSYQLHPTWRLGRQGGGLSEADTPMGLDIGKMVNASDAVDFPGWIRDNAHNDTVWNHAGDKVVTLGPYALQERGLAARLMQLDLDHDNRPELVFYDHTQGRWHIATPTAAGAPAEQEPQGNLLVAVEDGLGARQEVDYTPQWRNTDPNHPWTAADLALPYPLVSRPSAAAAAARLRTDSGLDVGDVPHYTTTEYLYGKALYDVRNGVNLGMDRAVVRQLTQTPDGTRNTRRETRFNTTPTFDPVLKAYPLAGTVLSETAMVWGPHEVARISHSGQRTSAHAGKQPGTWRQQLDASTASSYEVAADEPAATRDALFACLVEAFDGAKECDVVATPSDVPLSHGTSAFGYDQTGYGLLRNQTVETDGSTTVTERTFEHRDPASVLGQVYVLGLPTTQWVANEPSPGVGFTLRTSASAYDAQGRLKSTTIEPDRPQYQSTTSYTYDTTFGHVKTQTVSATGVPEATSTFEYGASGVYPVRVTNALGHSATTRWFEGCGLPEQQTTALGHTTVNDIDNLCRSTASQMYFGAQSLGRKVRTQYLSGMPASMQGHYPAALELATRASVCTQAEGGARSCTLANRVGQVLLTQAQGFGFETYTQARYDLLGRTVAASLPTRVDAVPAGWSTTHYDVHGRVVRIDKPDGSQLTTAYDRYITTATNELGHRGVSEVDALGQVVKVTPPSDPDAVPPSPDLSMCYAYGAFGTMTQAMPCVPNATKGPVTLVYDDYGHLLESHDTQAGVRITRYDALGRVFESEDARGQVTRMGYDVLGRLIQRFEAYGTAQQKVATWTYDTLAPGVLSEAVNAEGSVIERAQLDDLNRVSGSLTTIHGRSFRNTQAYDAWGRVVAHTAPTLSDQAPVITTNTYNDLDQVIQTSLAGVPVWQPIEADVWGHLTEQHYGGDMLVAKSSYDTLTGRLDDATVARRTWVSPELFHDDLLEHFSYDWFPHGLIRLRTSKALTPEANDQVDGFRYNPRGELTGWTTIGAQQQVTQSQLVTDGFGNILASPSGKYSYVEEKLRTIDGPLGLLTYAYDKNGNVIARSHAGGTTQLGYDALDRVDVIDAPGSRQILTYNADGEKVHVLDTLSGRETFYVGGYQEERGGALDATKQVIGRYALGPAHLTRTWNADLTYTDVLAYMTPADHLGSATLVTDSSGKVADRRSYDTWGNEREPADWRAFKAAPKDDLATPATGYTGTHERKQFGATAPGISGLIDMQARYYDPAAMRFLQADSLVPGAFNPTNWNRFAYANNSPVAFSDPTGHAAESPGDPGLDVTRHVQDAYNGLMSFADGFARANGLPAGTPSSVLGNTFTGAHEESMQGARATKPGGAHMETSGKLLSQKSVSEMSSEERFWVQAYKREKGNCEAAGIAVPFANVEEYQLWRLMSNEAQAMGMSSQDMEDMANIAELAADVVGFGDKGPKQLGIVSAAGPRSWLSRLFSNDKRTAVDNLSEFAIKTNKVYKRYKLDMPFAHKFGQLNVGPAQGRKGLALHMYGEEVGKIYDLSTHQIVALDKKFANIENAAAAWSVIQRGTLQRTQGTKLVFEFRSDFEGAMKFRRELTAHAPEFSNQTYRTTSSIQVGVDTFLPSEPGVPIHYNVWVGSFSGD